MSALGVMETKQANAFLEKKIMCAVAPEFLSLISSNAMLAMSEECAPSTGVARSVPRMISAHSASRSTNVLPLEMKLLVASVPAVSSLIHACVTAWKVHHHLQSPRAPSSVDFVTNVWLKTVVLSVIDPRLASTRMIHLSVPTALEETFSPTRNTALLRQNHPWASAICLNPSNALGSNLVTSQVMDARWHLARKYQWGGKVSMLRATTSATIALAMRNKVWSAKKKSAADQEFPASYQLAIW